MDFNLGSGFDGIDLSTITTGSDDVVLPDVAYGGADEQPSTPAANGFGNWVTGALDKALNYAIAKDAAEMNRPPTYQTAAPLPQQPQPYQGGGIKINGTMLLIGAGVLLFVFAKKG